MKILFIGDVFGRPGRNAVKTLLPRIQNSDPHDFVIANGENTTGGKGIDRERFDELISAGVNVVTGGNHIWQNRGILSFIDHEPRLIRPANYADPCPGRGYTVQMAAKGVSVAVINLMGRVFLPPFDCPFRKVDDILEGLGDSAQITIVDFHAEATSEKIAMSWYLDGRVSAVIGTHTHVQTADERILPKGSSAITDAGMTGPFDSVIGVRKDKIVQNFLSGRPVGFQTAKGDVRLQGVSMDIDRKTGKTKSIKRVSISLDD